VTRYSSVGAKYPDRLWAHTAYGGFFAGSKVAIHEGDVSPPSGAKVKNQWRNTSTSAYAVMTCARVNFPVMLESALVFAVLCTWHLTEHSAALFLSADSGHVSSCAACILFHVCDCRPVLASRRVLLSCSLAYAGSNSDAFMSRMDF
jgi:hypothetical protein